MAMYRLIEHELRQEFELGELYKPKLLRSWPCETIQEAVEMVFKHLSNTDTGFYLALADGSPPSDEEKANFRTLVYLADKGGSH